jgi:hypothetical protein
VKQILHQIQLPLTPDSTQSLTKLLASENTAYEWLFDREVKQDVSSMLGEFGYDESAIEADAFNLVADKIEQASRLLRRGATDPFAQLLKYRKSFADIVERYSDRMLAADEGPRLVKRLGNLDHGKRTQACHGVDIGLPNSVSSEAFSYHLRFSSTQIYMSPMLSEFDQGTIANITAALDLVRRKIPAGKDTNELRKQIADEIIGCARDGKHALSDLQKAGMSVLAETVPIRNAGAKNSRIRTALTAAVIVGALTYFVGSTGPGHRLLNAMGFATACGGTDNC